MDEYLKCVPSFLLKWYNLSLDFIILIILFISNLITARVLHADYTFPNTISIGKIREQF